MKNYSLLRVNAPTCTRHYVNGKQVSRALKSAQGALRHAEGVLSRQTRENGNGKS
jgi:hypothetical protein